MESITWKLEHELSGVGAGWTDMSGDVLLEYGGVEGQDGIPSTSPVALLASPGWVTWTYDNSPSNSGGKYGYYTPGHANCRAGFAKNIRVRFSKIYNGTAYYQNVYWLKKPIPSAGVFGEAVTKCRATDWLDLASNIPLPAVAVQTNKTADQLITTLMALVTTGPDSSTYATGDSTFASAFDMDDVERDSVYSVLGKICRSEFGRAYLQPSAGGGGVLTFENRNTRLGNVTSLGTISDTMDGVDIQDDAGQVYDQVKVSITPRRVDTSLVVLAKLDYKLQLTPGEERSFTVNYVEQTSGSRISGTNIQDPVKSTDYKFSASSGTTEELNDNLGVTMVRKGSNSSDVTVKNNGAVSGYVNLFNLQGYGIYPFNAYTVTVGTGGLRVLTFDMPYQNNPLTADAVCNYLQGVVSDNARRGARVMIHANKSSALMLAALTGGISSRWTLEETQSAMAGDWFINSRKWKVSLGNRLDMEWTVVPASGSAAWVLGTSALGVDTVLAV